MRTVIMILVIGVVASADPNTTYSMSPCDDSQYVALKSIPLDSLSQNEMIYFMAKEKECADYRGAKAQQRAEETEQSLQDEDWQKRKTGIIAGVTCGVIGMIALSVISLVVASQPVSNTSY